ncbi:proliferation-associated protein 2G4-like protein [Dinothrombium tinctorium]|uniref:Proliferation-associated protein 2G4-like protein n=1 Tax=Dinothrombium tinctorium TaxID=1965070 RepID=A0A3S3SLJ4_9ACAR|nr:proliferation-associated protein 2G4-like protein [Dinothrombium tinctorium]
MADKDDAEKTIATDIVVTKYKMGGEMVNRVLKELIKKCVAGESVIAICEHGDKLLNEETSKVFKKEKELKKGIAFPTCVSVNNCICHFSPLRSEPDYTLQDGDVVKLDLGAHIDGFIAVVAHTLVVGASPEKKVTGKKADVVLAAHYAAEVAQRLVRPGGENYAVTEAIQKAAESFKCKPISGMLSHQLKQFRIDGEKSIIQNPTEAQRKEHEKCEFELHEVYAIDVLISSGEGKGREMDAKTTVYKKTDEIYQLKMKASRTFFSEVDKRFGTMPFTLRAMEDERKARMGVVECVKHKLLEPFNVLYEKDGEFVAQFKFTVLLMPSGSHKITGLPIDLDCYESEHKIEDESIKNLLVKSAGPKSNKKKKKPAKTQNDTGGDKANDISHKTNDNPHED